MKTLQGFKTHLATTSGCSTFFSVKILSIKIICLEIHFYRQSQLSQFYQIVNNFTWYLFLSNTNILLSYLKAIWRILIVSTHYTEEKENFPVWNFLICFYRSTPLCSPNNEVIVWGEKWHSTSQHFLLRIATLETSTIYHSVSH